MSWVCPNCGRSFGARGRSHICKPGTTIDELASRSIDTFRPVYERIHQHLVAVDAEQGGELIVDPLDKLVQFKNGPMFAMIRPMTKWSAVSFHLLRHESSGRMSRKVQEYGGKFFHTVNFATVDEVDDEILEWLTEAYAAASPSRSSSSDPMVPDDIDFELG